MAEKDSRSRKETRRYCNFCLIVSDGDPEAEILKKNDELVCFKDICPAAPHHYLVVPREHLESCNTLHKGHIGLVKRMAELGREVLREQGVTDMTDVRLGFHKPPYTSVHHLHLHVLAPSSQIHKSMLYKFIPGSVRFITVSYLIKNLEDYRNHTCTL
ncbi:histidine triad nucleotide-binding protein 3-like [Salarias fasciatus]|nr:histidine triad nucleotide-binding protein 3-like [Salarias fasciatus]